MPKPSKNWFQIFSQWLPHAPLNQQELLATLRQAKEQHILHQDALSMLEGVLQVSQMRASEIMVPRSQMEVFEKDAPLEKMVNIVVESAHSRYPVVGEKRDEVVGIVLAKDLLQYAFSPTKEFHLRDILRPAVFIPDNKRLNILLAEFRQTRQHMAMVVDEYGGVTGLVTIEDILEQIVGDIADEHDIDEEAFVRQHSPDTYTVKAITELEYFNQVMSTNFSDEECDTIGGILLKYFGHLPKRGENITLEGLNFTILHADHRRIHLIKVVREAAGG